MEAKRVGVVEKTEIIVGDGRVVVNPVPPGTHENGLWRGRPAGVPSAGQGGRRPTLVRQALMHGFDERMRILFDIADGVPLERVRFLCQQCGTIEKGWTSASIDQVNKALEIMARYSLGTTHTLTDADGRDLPNAGGYDWSRLTTNELNVLEALLLKAKVTE